YDDRDGALQSCADCGRCQRACPAEAIDETGYHFQKCLRAHMGKERMPDWVMEKMRSMLGCDICQQVCPCNAGLECVPAMPEAFSLERLLKNDIREALELVGFNQKSGGRLLAHAAVLAANLNRYDLLPLLEPLCSDPREAVRAAAEYAISRLHNLKTMV
ncbi:MAG: 4Fe-4S double cluster binding domain-containing protein, partial [Clostridia bacterium]|nr:4Fe-4S double cluster binding domain-containing protein [Clostridia bacterium]